MSLALALGWIAALVLIGSFGIASMTGRYHQYEVVNLLTSFILMPANIAMGNSFGAFISLAYGTFSAVHLARRLRKPVATFYPMSDTMVLHQPVEDIA